MYWNRAWDTVAAGFVRWTTLQPDFAGTFYPGPGTFGVDTSDETVERVSDVLPANLTLALNQLVTTTGVEVVVGGGIYTPLGPAPVFRALCLSNSAAGTLEVLLYDLGAPGSGGAGVLRSTLTIPFTGGVVDVTEAVLDPVAAPGVNLDEISTAERMYELRAMIGGGFVPGDTLFVESASIEVT